MLKDTITLGAKIYACEMAMNVMGVTKADLIGEVADIAGVAAFIANAEGGQALFT